MDHAEIFALGANGEDNFLMSSNSQMEKNCLDFRGSVQHLHPYWEEEPPRPEVLDGQAQPGISPHQVQELLPPWDSCALQEEKRFLLKERVSEEF